MTPSPPAGAPDRAPILCEYVAPLERGQDVEGASHIDGAGYYWTDEIRGWEIAR